MTGKPIDCARRIKKASLNLASVNIVATPTTHQ